MCAKRDFACMPRYIRAHETTSSGHSTGSEPNTLGLIVQALLACGQERTDEAEPSDFFVQQEQMQSNNNTSDDMINNLGKHVMQNFMAQNLSKIFSNGVG